MIAEKVKAFISGEESEGGEPECGEPEGRADLIAQLKSYGKRAFHRLDVDDLSIESLEAAVFALEKHADLSQEINSGAPPEGVKQLACLMARPGFDVNSVFTEDGSFIDYGKVDVLFRS